MMARSQYSNYNINLRGSQKIMLEDKNIQTVISVGTSPKSLMIVKTYKYEKKTTTDEKKMKEDIIHLDHTASHEHIGVLTLTLRIYPKL